MVTTLSKSNSEYVSILREEYQEYLEIKKIIPILRPTKADSVAIRRGKKEINSRNYISWQVLKNELANNRSNKNRRKAN